MLKWVLLKDYKKVSNKTTMYLPIWLIGIIGLIGSYYFIRSKRSKKHNLNTEDMSKAVTENFSYKLDIVIMPWWFKLYQKSSVSKSEKKLLEEIKKKEKDTDDIDSNLYGRRYIFTEYYDSSTGLTSRFQRVTLPSQKQVVYPVDEFGDRGFFFSSDIGSGATWAQESDKVREQRTKLSIEICENFIRNDIYGRVEGGGPKSDFDYEKANYLFSFPLHDIFNFLFALGKNFHGAESNIIIKWPDHIEAKFKEHGIKYETFFDYEPREFDMETYDKEFVEKWGNPKVSLSSGSSNMESTEDGTTFGVSLKIFRPGENDRIHSS